MGTRSYCSNCQRPTKTCLCDALVTLDCNFQLIILQDPSEAKHALSSAPILEKSIRDSKLIIGDVFNPEKILGLNWKSNSLLVFPGEHALTEQEAKSKKFKHLILLDGTWRKVTRMLHANEWLQELPCIAIDVQHASQYTIRKSPRTDGLSTIEAAVYVLNVLHSKQDFAQILKAFEKMIALQISAMGEETFQKNYNV